MSATSETPQPPTLREQLQAWLDRRHHVEEEDCWFSCPKSGECCNENQPDTCTCGKDELDKTLRAALTALSQPSPLATLRERMEQLRAVEVVRIQDTFNVSGAPSNPKLDAYADVLRLIDELEGT